MAKCGHSFRIIILEFLGRFQAFGGNLHKLLEGIQS